MKPICQAMSSLRDDVDSSIYWEVDYFRRPYGLFLLLLAFLRREHRLHKAIQRGFEVAYSFVGFTMLDRHFDTMFDVVFQNGFAHLVKRGAHGSNLCQHVVALAPFFPQPFKAVGMSGDAREPFGDVLA